MEFGPELGSGGGSPQSSVFVCGASAPCCLTIASEKERRGRRGPCGTLVVGLNSSASLEPIRGLESEETTDGHVSKIHRASRERCQTVVRRAGRKPLLRRMCLELVKNTV